LAKFLMVPRDTKFYDLFEQDTRNLVVAAEKLADLFDHYEDVEVKAKQLKDLETAGDVITHQIIQRLHSTFVTPIDREDIALLAHSLDDVMDYIEQNSLPVPHCSAHGEGTAANLGCSQDSP